MIPFMSFLRRHTLVSKQKTNWMERKAAAILERHPALGRFPWGPVCLGVLLFLTPLVTVAACQTVSLQSAGEAWAWIGSHPGAAALSWLLLLALLGMLWGLLRLLSLAALLSQGIPLVLTLISYYKTIINGEPLMLTDFALAGDLGTVAGYAGARLTLSGATLGAILAVAAMALLGLAADLLLPRLRARQGMAAFGVLALALALAVNGPLGRVCAAYYRQSAMQVDRDAACGVPLSLLSTWLGSQAEGSGDYSELRMRRLLQQMEGDLADQRARRGEGTERPHIIYIMNESFFGVTRLPNVTFSQDPLPNYRRLSASADHGRFYSITCGGGTGLVEMETFTGVPSVFLSGDTANTDLAASDYEAMPSYVRVLRDNGYRTIAFHSHTSELYNRSENYPHIGFDQVLFYDSYMSQATYEGGYFDDDSTVDVIISLFEENRDEPVYLYAMTMQNHQPYYAGRYQEDRVTVTADGLSQEALECLQCYVNGVYDADRMLGRLVDYFSAVDESVILVFSGDHMPSMTLTDGSTVYAQTGFTSATLSADWEMDDYQRMFATDYLIWTNFSQGGEERAASCTMMGAEILDLAGVDNTPYYAWLAETGRELVLYRYGNLLVGPDGNLLEAGEREEAFLTDWSDVVYDMLYGEGYIAPALRDVRRSE